MYLFRPGSVQKIAPPTLEKLIDCLRQMLQVTSCRRCLIKTVVRIKAFNTHEREPHKNLEERSFTASEMALWRLNQVSYLHCFEQWAFKQEDALL